MSTEDQADSPERQRSLVLPYCERKGYRVVEVYQDLGMRGWDDDRPDFQRLMRDARNKRFDLIVVDEQSRLCRNDPIDFAATVAHPLREAGVALEMVDQGQRLTWDGNDLGGLLLGVIGQYKASQESSTLGRRTATGMARKAKEGKMFPGRAPYGTRYKLVEGKRVGYEEGDTDHLRVVRFMFDAYFNRDLSLMALVRDLNSQGIPTPQGCKEWGKTTVHNILTNHVYAGCYVWGKVPQGRYFRCDGVEVVVADKCATKSRRLPPAECFILPGQHPPLVDPVLFDRVQERLVSNRNRTSGSRLNNEHPLSDLLRCSHCGRHMYGAWVVSGGVKVPTYRCGSDMSNGTCRPYQVRESVLTGKLAEVLQEKFLADLDRIRASLHRQKADPTQDVAEELRKKIERLNSKASKARHNLPLLEAEFLSGVQAQIRAWECERAEAQAQLDRLARQSPADDVEELAANAAQLIECMRSADPATVRALWQATIGQVDLRFDAEPKKKLTRYPLAGGVLHLLESADSSTSGPGVAR
jgi:DNA invertase Pin-like site-specific DNA recombinase